MNRWRGIPKPRAPVRTPCRNGCGVEVEQFTDTETGLTVRLEVDPLPITRELTDPTIRYRIYEWRGEYAGWCPKNTVTRTWREIRLTHKCGNDRKEVRP